MTTTPKLFTETDALEHGCIAGAGSISVNYPEDLIHAPLWWHKQGLSKTASGYGAKIESAYKINFNGRLYRLYHTCYGNSSSAWFTARGRKYFVN